MAITTHFCIVCYAIRQLSQDGICSICAQAEDDTYRRLEAADKETENRIAREIDEGKGG